MMTFLNDIKFENINYDEKLKKDFLIFFEFLL